MVGTSFHGFAREIDARFEPRNRLNRRYGTVVETSPGRVGCIHSLPTALTEFGVIACCEASLGNGHCRRLELGKTALPVSLEVTPGIPCSQCDQNPLGVTFVIVACGSNLDPTGWWRRKSCQDNGRPRRLLGPGPA